MFRRKTNYGKFREREKYLAKRNLVKGFYREYVDKWKILDNSKLRGKWKEINFEKRWN